jgi:hypothetical protein
VVLRDVILVRARPDPRLADLDLPLRVVLSPESVVTFDRRPAEATPEAPYQIISETRVDPRRLELVTDTGSWRERPDGTRESIHALRLTGSATPQGPTAHDVLTALSFMTDVPFNMSASPFERPIFVPETSEENELLDEFGTRLLHTPLSGRTATRTFSARLDPEAIQRLLPKRVGLQLYADAISLAHPVAQYRELWRVLESAFGAEGEELVGLLKRYEPAKQIDFTPHELAQLYVLRGRASHAQSRLGISEISAVASQCSARIPRLKCLVERVIITKKSWGLDTLAYEELFRLTSWVGPERGENCGTELVWLLRSPTKPANAE